MLLNLQQKEVKRPSSNPKSERYFWLNSHVIEGISNINKGEPIPVNQFSDLVTSAGLAALNPVFSIQGNHNLLTTSFL